MHKKTHTHHHSRQEVQPSKLLTATLLNLVITLVELAGSVLSGSVALLSDALHNLGDTFATFIAYLASRIGKRSADSRHTFGFRRIEILSALFNAVILLVTCVFLIREAWLRFREPGEINSLIMIVVGMIGLLANVYALSLLRSDARHSLNVRAAYLHLLGDALSSVLVIAGGVAIHFLGLLWIDPLITVLISLYIIREAFALLKETVSILMQSAPGDLDLDKIRHRVENLPGILNMHHVHLWKLTDQDIHLEAHVEFIENLRLSETQTLQKEIEDLLRQEFQISHLTLQFEFDPTHEKQFIQEKKP